MMRHRRMPRPRQLRSSNIHGDRASIAERDRELAWHQGRAAREAKAERQKQAAAARRRRERRRNQISPRITCLTWSKSGEHVHVWSDDGGAFCYKPMIADRRWPCIRRAECLHPSRRPRWVIYQVEPPKPFVDTEVAKGASGSVNGHQEPLTHPQGWALGVMFTLGVAEVVPGGCPRAHCSGALVEVRWGSGFTCSLCARHQEKACV